MKQLPTARAPRRSAQQRSFGRVRPHINEQMRDDSHATEQRACWQVLSSKRDGGARGRIPRFATPSCDAARGHLARRMSATEQPNAASAMGSVAGAAVEEKWCGAFSRTSFCSTSSSGVSSPSAAFAVSCLRSFASACNRGWRCHGSGGSSADCTVGISGAWAQARGIAFKLRGSCYRAVFKRRGCCYRAQ